MCRLSTSCHESHFPRKTHGLYSLQPGCIKMFNALNPPFSPVCALRRTIQLIVCAMHGNKLFMLTLFHNLSLL